VNTFLATAIRTEGWFTILNYLNGLVAPSFLFISGFVQGMSFGVAPAKPVNYGRRTRQLLILLGIAFALHFPWTELGQHRYEDALRVGSQVDVLQCIATSLGVLLGVTWLAQKLQGRRGVIFWWVALLALVLLAVFIAPAANEMHGLPVPLQAWVNRDTGSWFPLPTWAGFVFLGALGGAVYGRLLLRAEAALAEGRVSPLPILKYPSRVLNRMATLFLITPLPFAIVVGLWSLASVSPASPASFFSRAAWVLIFAALGEWFASWRKPPALPLFAGKHSLALYVIHLVLISTLVGWGVPTTSMPLGRVCLWIVGVATVSLALTWVVANWRRFLSRREAMS
jgi:hypothetical protein